MTSNQIEELSQEKFEDFTGNESYLINRITNSNHLTNIPFIHSQMSGLLSELGIDLGRCDVYTYYNYIDIRYSEVQSRIVSKRLFKRGIEVTTFDTNEIEYFDGNKGEIRSYSSEKKELVIRSIYHSLWTKSLILHSDWLSEIEGYGQTIFLSWLYDYGLINSRRFNQICKAIKTGDKCTISKELLKDHDNTDSLYWKENRLSDIAYLIGDRLELTGSVGTGGANDASDIAAVNEILNEKLGFDALTNANFDGLESFMKMVGLENEPVLLTKYNLAYIWLVSENAPKIVQSVDTDLVKFDAQTDVLNWVYDSLKATGIRLGHTFASKLYADEAITNFDIEVQFMNSEDLKVEISIPRATSSAEIRTDNPDYNQEGMEYLLQAMCADENIIVQNIGLRDPDMAAKGLCNLIGERREESGIFKFREDFSVSTAWDSAPLGPDRILLTVSRNGLSDISPPQVPTEDEEVEPEELDASNEIMEAMKNGEDISDLMESYSLQFGPSWAPNDAQERAAYFIAMMKNHSSGTYVDQNGTEQTSVIPAIFENGRPYLLGIKNWLFDRPFSDGYNVYGDTIYLLYSLNNILHCSAYRASIRPGKSRSYTNIYGDAIPQPGHTLFEIDTFLGNTRLKQATGINVVRDREKSGYLDDLSRVECLDVNYKFGFGKKNTVGNDANRTFCLHGGNDAGSPYETFISELTSTLGYNDGDTVLMTIIDERYILPGVSLDEGGD